MVLNERRDVTADDTGLHVTALGESGPLVAFCHGLFGQGKNWTTIAKAVAEDHRVLLVDMPHHGRSAWAERFDYVDVADRVVRADGSVEWRRSPGGLVSALVPVMQENHGAWIGWPGSAGDDLEPFEDDGIALVPIAVSQQEYEEFYEGFSNATLWPLYHDVVAKPEFHREWWDEYVNVNRRFAEKAAELAAKRATVWVHDYQLQLVP